MKAEKGKGVIVKGNVRVIGETEVLGAKINSFFTSKPLPVYCLSDCEIFCDEAKILEVQAIPESWEKLAKKDWEVVFLYGGTDSGKSSLATFLANRNGGAYVLDLDIGQADIAHPGAMGYGYACNVLSLRDVKMINGFFVGKTSPMGIEARCLKGVAKLWKEMKKLEGRKIIDTTGWVKGEKAKDYKLAKLEIIEPDIIASFEGKPAEFDEYEIFEVQRGAVFVRDKDERLKARCESYLRWLETAETIEVRDVKLYPDIFSGKILPTDFLQEVSSGKIVFARKTSDHLVIFVKDEIDQWLKKALKDLYELEVFVVAKDTISGLYKGKKYLGMGLLQEISEDSLKILTPHKDFDKVVFGSIRFSSGKEITL